MMTHIRRYRRSMLMVRLAAWFMVYLGLGCAGPGPRLLPSAPLRIEQPATGGKLLWYDTNSDGTADYAEQMGPDGRINVLRYICDHGEQEVVIDAIPASQRRDLVIILDSVPFSMVREAWERGDFRFFPPPSRVIAPFPVMTDPSLVDFFQMSPGIAIESAYYDGRRETGPYELYLNSGVAIWHEKVDYFLPHSSHAPAYLDPLPWFNHELRAIQKAFECSDRKTYIAYSVGTSALGATQGWEGHAKGLSQINRFCRQLMYRTRGRARITLFSDHGHNDLEASRRIPLARLMRSFGYRIHDRLKSPNDLIVPEFAMVSCAAMYTLAPAGPARDAAKIAGIDLTAYADADGGIVVVNHHGDEGRISRSDRGYKYEILTGDPLALQPILADLATRGKIDTGGFVADDVLFAATCDHVYADPADRLWRAFHEQFQHKPHVLLSVLDGYHCGSAFQTRAIGKLRGVHGNLRPLSTLGFAMTAAGELPPALRMRDLSAALDNLGVNVLRPHR